MPTKASKNLADFWESKTGKTILSYGKWLIGVGILLIIGYSLFAIYMMSEFFLATTPVLYIIIYVISSLAFACYYITFGVRIIKKKLSPEKMSHDNTYVIVFVVLKIVVAIIVAILSSNTHSIQPGLLDVLEFILLYDAIKYKRKWHNDYCQAYKNTKKTQSKKASQDSGLSTEEKIKRQKIKSYIIYFCVILFCIIIIILPLINNIVFYSEETSEEIISSQTVYEETSDIELGQSRVKVYGYDGKKEVVYKVGRRLFTGEVSREEVSDKIIVAAKDTVIEKGTKRYRFMWCSDNTYKYYYEDDYNSNKNIGYTWSGEDFCQKDGHGVRTNVADYPPPSRYYYYY